MDSHEIDPIYFDKPYYVVTADDLAEEVFVVLRDALKRSHKIGLGQLAMRGREYVVSIKGCGRGIVMETLRYADEVHKAASYFRDIGDTMPDDDLLDLAQTLIDKKTGKFDASDFHDRYVDALRELIERKKQARRITIEDEKGRRSARQQCRRPDGGPQEVVGRRRRIGHACGCAHKEEGARQGGAGEERGAGGAGQSSDAQACLTPKAMRCGTWRPIVG